MKAQHRLDLSAGEQRPRSAHVHGGRRKERKCEAEESHPHEGFGQGGGGGSLFTVFTAPSRRFVLQSDMILRAREGHGVPSLQYFHRN